MLVNLIDGGIVKFSTDSNFYVGHCDTCDFGQEHVSTINIKLIGINIDVNISKSYEYPLSEEFLMITILPNHEDIKKMTEREFSKWLKEKLEEELGWDLNDKEYQVY